MRARTVAAALGACAALCLLASAPASAADSGVLVVDPASGTLDSTLMVSTVGPCERGVSAVVYAEGKGIDRATADNLVGNTSLAKIEPTFTAAHSVPLMTTLGAYFQSTLGRAPKGDYDIVFACRNSTDFTDLQTFRATLSFDKEGNYTVTGPSAGPLAESLADAGYDVVAGLPEQVRALAGDPLLGDLGSTEQTSEVEATASQTPVRGGQDMLRMWLIAAGLLLIGGAAFYWWRTRRSQT